MKKKRTLFMHEFRTAIGFLLVAIVAVLIFTGIWDSGIYSQIKNGVTSGYGGAFINYNFAWIAGNISTLLFFGIAIFVVCQFANIRSGNSGQFVQALPFKRKTLYQMKISVGVGTITIPYLILLARIIYIHRKYFDRVMRLNVCDENFSNIYSHESLETLLMQWVLLYLFAIGTYFVFVLMETLIYRHFMAVLLGFAATITPMMIFMSWASIVRRFSTNLPEESIEKIGEILAVFWGGSTFDLGRYSFDEYVNYIGDGGFSVCCIAPGAKIIFLLLLIAILAVSSYFVWIKQDEAKTSVMIPSRGIRISLFACIMAGVITVASYLTVFPVEESFMAKGLNTALSCVAIVVVSAVGAFLYWLLVRKRGGDA